MTEKTNDSDKILHQKSNLPTKESKRWYEFWKRKSKPVEYHGVQEWIGEKWCIVCDKMIYEHYPIELKYCVNKVKEGYRLH